MRALKVAGKVALGVLATLLVLVVMLVAFPGIALNTRTLQWAAKKYGGDYRLRWSELTLEVRSTGVLTKRARLKAKDLCFEEVHGAASGCVTELELDATGRLGLSPPVTLARVETFVLRTGTLRADPSKAPKDPEAERKKAEHGTGGSARLALASRMTLGRVEVVVPRAELHDSSGTTAAGLAVSFASSRSGPLTATAWAVLPATGSSRGNRFDASLSVDTDLFREGKLTRLEAKARASGDGLSADASARVVPEGDGASGSASIEATLGGRRLTAKLDGKGGPGGGSAAFDARMSDPKGAVRRAALEGCKATLELGKDETARKAALDCGLALLPAPFGAARGAVPGAFAGTLRVRGAAKARTARRDRFETTVEVRLGPSRGGGFSLAADAALAGHAGGGAAGYAAERKVSVRAEISRFASFVKLLEKTDLAVPAPLDALDGTVKAAAEAESRAGGSRTALSWTASTDLKSAKQSVVIGAKGKATLAPPGHKTGLRVETEVDLKKVVLELPYLELKGAPAPATDKRIKTGDPARDAAAEAFRAGAVTPRPSTADYDATVFTSSPVVLLTNLVKSPIPVSMRLHADPSGLAGTVRVEPFDLEVFRQVARVDHLTLTPHPGAAATGVDGKVIYKRGDTTVNVIILGSSAKPSVSFESDPPMTQDEIVALLLYGKSNAELDADQKASAGNASNAMTNGAFGLASLYLFASTPVDSVGYDAATQSYQVKFKLPAGATLSVGSNLQESRTLTLRKRLARHFELQTEAGRATRERGSITTFLQWFERY